MKQKHYVYVLNKKGKPLMPTTRCGHVRKLLKQGLAVPVNNNPFTIRLKYDTPDITQALYLGIDTGRENIGEGVSNAAGDCVFLCNTETHNKAIKKQMNLRAGYRKSRRQHKRQKKQRKAIKNETVFKHGNEDILQSKKICKSRNFSYPGMDESVTHKVIQGAEAQFNNRNIPKGWITPSGRQLIQVHLECLKQTMKILPISHVILERVCFDFQQLENHNINTWQYSKGPLYGYNSYQDYIYDQQNGICLICCKNHIDEYHHIVPLSQDGSNTPANIAGLCHNCHQGKNGVHKNQELTDYLKTLKGGLKTKYSIGLLNSVMPILIDKFKDFCKDNNIEFATTNGYKTAQTRNELGLDKYKTHCIDGFCISLANRGIEFVGIIPDGIYQRQRFKKKSANNINTLNNRKYKFRDKVVALNRHKATEQTQNSLEEYMLEYAQTHTDKECAQHLHELKVCPAERAYTYHKDGIVCKFHSGDKIRYTKAVKYRKTVKTNVFICESAKISLQRLCYNKTKNYRIKYCTQLESGCIPYVKVIKFNLKEHI